MSNYDQLVPLSAIAEALSVTHTTVNRWAERDDFPQPIFDTRPRLYDRGQVDQWLTDNVMQNEAGDHVIRRRNKWWGRITIVGPDPDQKVVDKALKVLTDAGIAFTFKAGTE